jgi:CIC family chloride channel protein
VKALIPTGSSAALAAAFNTPISAVLFSLEEVMGDMHAPVLGSIVLASATSWIVLHLILGDEPLFHVPAYQLVHPVEFMVYAVLGIAGGLVSVSFVKLLLWQRKRFAQAPRAIQWALPATGGLCVGLLGWFFPEVLGVGYAFVGQALNGQMLIGSMALLVALKVVATATCYASGNAGGIFGPSLFMGAMLGGTVGGLAHSLMPDYTGSVGAYALVGMGAAFAGIIRVPLTSVIMVFEITRDYSIVVPLMIANLISYYISSRLQPLPIYEALQHQDGVRLPTGARARESLLTAAYATRADGARLAAEATVAEALTTADRAQGAWPVIDEEGLCGVIALGELEAAVEAGRGDAPLRELVREKEPAPYIFPDDSLDIAMRWLASGRVKVLPVVGRTNDRELKGTISLEDGLAAYALGRTQPAAQRDRLQGRRTSAALLGWVVAALAGLAVLAGSLSYFYRAERSRRADQSYQAGQEFARNGRYPEAIEQYRHALSISHDLRHRLALALALVDAGRMNEAAIYLEEVLRDQPSSGPGNLGMAAVEAARDRTESAILHYRRAATGSWPERPEHHRFEARMALAAYLRKAGRHAEARAEALAIAARPPNDQAVQKRIGWMLIEFGLAQSAADLFRQLLNAGPPDAEEYRGVGEAEFRMADYQHARDAFRKALQIAPDDSPAADRARVCDRVLSLDPSQRGLGSRERFRRSQELLREALSAVTACAGAERALPPALAGAAGPARAALERKRPSSYSDAAEANVSLASSLWAERLRACGPPALDDPLALVMGHLASVGAAR